MGRPPAPQPALIYIDADQDTRFHVHFPKGVYENALLLLVATGSVQEPDSGQTKKSTIQFYNITIPVKDDSEAEADRIVASTARLINVSPGKTVSRRCQTRTSLHRLRKTHGIGRRKCCA
jgi:hypothetical protein